MNDFQAFYLFCLAALTVAGWGRAGFVLACLWGNAVATLAAAFAMDIGLVTRGDATLFYMVIDAATGAALLIRPGLARIIALLYVVTVPLYLLDLIAGMDTEAMFAFVYAAALLQLGALAVGIANSGNGRGGHRGRGGGRNSLAVQGGHNGLAFGPVAQVSGDSLDRGRK